MHLELFLYFMWNSTWEELRRFGGWKKVLNGWNVLSNFVHNFVIVRVIAKPDTRVSMGLRILLQLHSCVRLVSTRQLHELASLRHVFALPEKKRLALLYPFSSLEAHLSRQVDKTRFQLFQPDLEALKRAERLFTPSPKHQMVYSSSAVRTDHLPELTQPEVRAELVISYNDI